VGFLDIRSFIDQIIGGVESDEILHCSKVEDLNVNRQYRIIFLNHLIENTPVFVMNGMWEKIKITLTKAGLIIIKTLLYGNPNEFDKDECNKKQIRYNKQTNGTFLKECLKQNMILAHSCDDCFALIRREELSLFNVEQQKSFTAHHNMWLSKYGLLEKEHYSEDDYRKLVPGAGRMMIGCVAENNKKYQTQALRLVQSIRWFGGKIAGANIFVCMVDEADPEFVAELKKWNVFVRIVKRFSVMHPPSNKLRFFELSEISSYDTIMLLDCDTVIVQDPYPFIDGYHFQAEIAAGATVSAPLFRKLLAHYNLMPPRQRYITSVSKQPTIWYSNTGVLIFPNTIIKTFYPIWRKYTIDLCEKRDLLEGSFFYCEQASLSIAFSTHPVRFKRLPIQMNYHLPLVTKYGIKNIDPVIIHYHHLNEQSGYLKIVTQNPFVMHRINFFNDRLRKELQLKKVY
jgi:hypothetical protein